MDAVPPALAEQPAAVCLQVTDEVAALHTANSSGSRARLDPERLLGDLTIGLDDQGDSLPEVLSAWSSVAPGYWPGQLLDEGE